VSDALYIDTAEGLEALCAELHGAPWLALDTEFIREKSYYPRLCLIQIAVPGTIACVDPLALPDLQPLLACLAERETLKVLHAATQDMEIFYHLTGSVPGPVFDTQIAAAALGHGDQTGYGKLVQAVLGLELEKGHARTDWSQRPLDREQLRYAEDDVRYLLELYPRLRERLDTEGRADWIREDLLALEDPARYAPDPAGAYRRLRGVNTLKPRQLNVARALAAWREERAMRADRPRRWILQDEVLIDLARHTPRDERALGKIRGLDENQRRRSGAELLQCIEEALAEPAASWPTAAARVQLDHRQDALADALMAVLRASAEQARVSAGTLASRKDIERLVAGERDLNLLRGWRGQLVGTRLLDFLEGRLSLRVTDGRLQTLEPQG
jgi:ribonuclease D